MLYGDFRFGISKSDFILFQRFYNFIIVGEWGAVGNYLALCKCVFGKFKAIFLQLIIGNFRLIYWTKSEICRTEKRLQSDLYLGIIELNIIEQNPT